MIFHSTDIQGLWVIEPIVHEDSRGFFMETYRRDEFLRNGINTDFVQDNHSRSFRGALRGLHYQISPEEQIKLVRVLSGEIFDVVVDLRRASKTFGKHFSVRLSSDNRKMLYVPAGFAHGFLTLSDRADVAYKVSRPYSAQHERGILWSDPALQIQWPNLGMKPILSEKDKRFPGLSGAAV